MNRLSGWANPLVGSTVTGVQAADWRRHRLALAAQHSPLVLHPGDRVLVGLLDTDPDRLADLADGLRRHFPGVDFVFVAGVTALAVLGDPSEPGADHG